MLAESIPAHGQESALPLSVTSAQVGIGNRAKAGYWTPIWLTLKAGSAGARGNLVVVTPDGDQAPVVYADQPGGKLDLDAGGEQRVMLYAKLGPVTAPIDVQLRDGETTLWSKRLSGLPARLDATQPLFVSAGAELGLDAALKGVRRPDEEPPVAVHVSRASGLPDRWWGYEGVDCLVLTTSDPAFLSGLTEEQQTAVRQWVELGGRLVLCCGSRGKELYAEDSPWRELLPATGVIVGPLRDRTGLESLTGSQLPWESDAFRPRPEVTRLAGLHSIVVLDELGAGTDRPLVTRVPRAFGQVIFVGLDLNHPGFAAWAGRPALLSALIQRPEGGQHDRQAQAVQSVTHLGFEDLVGQLRAALDQFPGVTFVTFTTVSILTVLFLLLIGPGDYLLLSWLRLPRQWTWGTFGLVVAAFGLAAWQLGADAHGSKLRLNQVELVDIDAQTGLVRGTVWSHLYSPSAGQFDIDLEISLPQGTGEGRPQGWLAWQGLPGKSLGGLSSRQVTLATPDAYSVRSPGPDPRLFHLPVETASSKSLSARWWSSRGSGQAPLTDSVHLARTENGLLSGELTNPLPVDLTDAILAYSDRMYRIKTFKSGQKIHLDPYESEFPPLDLESRLTDRKPFQDKQVTSQWQHESLDIPRIMQMLMLHEAARGSGYTGLTHRYQPYVDFTEHVQSERAVLIGRGDEPVARLQVRGQNLPAGDSRTFTWYRLVFPVEYAPTSNKQP
jgi:hypothetical protein